MFLTVAQYITGTTPEPENGDSDLKFTPACANNESYWEVRIKNRQGGKGIDITNSPLMGIDGESLQSSKPQILSRLGILIDINIFLTFSGQDIWLACSGYISQLYVVLFLKIKKFCSVHYFYTFIILTIFTIHTYTIFTIFIIFNTKIYLFLLGRP